MKRAIVAALAWALLSSCASKDDAEPGSDSRGGSATGGSAGSASVTTEKELEATVDCVSMMESGPKTAGYVQYAFTWAPLKGGGESHMGRYMEDSELRPDGSARWRSPSSTIGSGC